MEREALAYEKRRKIYRKLRRVGKALFVMCAALCCVGCGVLGYIIFSAPPLSLEDVAPDGYRSVVLDDKGNEILPLVGPEANRVYVTVEEIPLHLQQAFVAIEDERFYQHHGIDLQGIVRAVVSNIKSGSLRQGASTIPQQLIKNNLLTEQWNNETTAWDKIRRKLQEQWLAIQLDASAEKDWILENYLNTINLGGGTWGVQTASRRYFGKDVRELTLSESAVLAAIPKSPGALNPLKDAKANAARRVLVLDKMLELGWISAEAYRDAMADDVYSRIAENSTAAAVEVFSYFEDELIRQVVQDLQRELGFTEEQAWRLVYRGGITIHSTQDTNMQTICETEINRDSWYSDSQQASVVVMDPYTGHVKAIVGGRGEKDGSLVFNRASDSVRQPGSTLKVVGEYAAALDSGEITLGRVYDDAPYTYSNGTPVKNASGSYAGRLTVRSAIADSVNTVALKCFQDAGMDLVWEYLDRFGFSHLTGSDKVESLALGGTHGGVTNLELTAAYGAIAGGGTYYRPTYYTKVTDREGKELLRWEGEEKRVLQPSTAALLTDAMTDVLDEGSGRLACFEGMPLAGKSGTTSEMRDVWFVGYSPYYVCGVWGGYDDYLPQSGSSYVKRIWRAVMEQGHADKEYVEFAGADSLVQCSICSKCGLLAVAGLCDQTVQGDVTYEEWFASGTEPVASCSCHAAVQICPDSGMPVSSYCPAYGTKSVAYLKSGTAGTADAAAVLPVEMRDYTCSVHYNWWNWFFPDYGADIYGDGGEPESVGPVIPEAPVQEPPRYGNPLIDWFYGLQNYL